MLKSSLLAGDFVLTGEIWKIWSTISALLSSKFLLSNKLSSFFECINAPIIIPVSIPLKPQPLLIYFNLIYLTSPEWINNMPGDETGLASQLISTSFITHPAHERLTTTPGTTHSTLREVCGFFNVPLYPCSTEDAGDGAYQGTKKLVSDSPRPVDFPARLVDFTLNLPKGRVKVLGEIVFEEFRQAGKLNFFVPCLRLIVLIREDLNVKPFAGIITKAAHFAQLF